MTLSKYPPAIQAKALTAVLQEEYKSSLYKTAKDLLGYRDMTWRTHGPMIGALEDARKKKLIVMPRGTFKSSVASVAYPIWRLLNNPNLRILIDSEVYSNSKNFLREIRAHLLGNEKLKLIFGEFKSDNWNESEITISQRRVIKKEASITCGGIGTVKVGQHYDLIIGDDLNSHNNSATSEGRDKVLTHYKMYTGLLDPGGEIVIVGTRYAVNDCIGHILDNEIGAVA